MEKHKEEHWILTTVHLTKEMHDQTKMMALLTGKPMSHIIRMAISDKLKELKGQIGK